MRARGSTWLTAAVALQVIANPAAEKHGGTLSFETEVGRGTTFMFRIPVEPHGKAAA